MADELDAMLQESNQTPASQAQTQVTGTDSTQGETPLEQQTPEEVEFNKLSGSAQDRFKEAWRRTREAEERLSAIQSTQSIPPAPQTTPDQQNAIAALENAGLATDRKVDEKINTVLWEIQQQKLEGKYDGSRGEPQYVREEVEDFISKHPQYRQYDAEDVFRYKMFPDEFASLDRGKGTRTGRSTTLKPTKASVQENTLTPEGIEEHLKQPDGREWYEEHLTEINKVLSQGQ